MMQLTSVPFTDDKEVISYFTEGQCGALAYELHKLKGWTIAMLSSLPAGSPDYSGHVFIIDSDGMAIDIVGRRTLDEIKEDWYFCKYIHRFFTLKEFEYEMLDWNMATRFDKDKEARRWAKLIVEALSDPFI